MLDRITAAGACDLNALYRFYEEVCAAQETDEYGPCWHIGVYPDREDIAAYIDRGEALLGLAGDRIAASLMLASREDPMYADIPWNYPVPAESVAVIHLFAVHPDFRRLGVSREMLLAAFSAARVMGKRAIHLDLLKGNLPAERLYRRMGFAFAGERSVYYEDTGDITVRLYEYVL